MDTVLLGADGSRLVGSTWSFSAPGEIRVPVFASAAARFVGEAEPMPLRERFGERVYRLSRVTAADHLGPTEAEYREVSDAL